MATPAVSEIESEFARLSPEAQLTLLNFMLNFYSSSAGKATLPSVSWSIVMIFLLGVPHRLAFI
ncbi:MAG: hypothetical protein FJ398_05000 [Verrucomicrobia bacterium]|nr:hypothetical protein [Verrucomicrobiota bacterium]